MTAQKINELTYIRIIFSCSIQTGIAPGESIPRSLYYNMFGAVHYSKQKGIKIVINHSPSVLGEPPNLNLEHYLR